MRCRLAFFAVTTCISLAGSLPAMAQSHGSLDCMAMSYNAEDQAALEGFTMLGDEEGEGAQADSRADGIVLETVSFCSDKYEWSEDAFTYAFLYELGRLGEAELRNNGTFPRDQQALVDAELARTQNKALWAALENIIWQELVGEESGGSEADDITLGTFVIAAGTEETEEMDVLVGELLAMLALQRIGRAEFEALYAD